MYSQDCPLSFAGATIKPGEFDKEKKKRVFGVECRSWPAKEVQRVELVGKKRESLHQVGEFVCVFKRRDRAVCGR